MCVALFQQNQELSNVTRNVRLRIWIWKTADAFPEEKRLEFPFGEPPIKLNLTDGNGMKTRALNILQTSE